MRVVMEHAQQTHEFIAPQSMERLDSLVSKACDISRAKVKKIITDEAVTVDGIVCTDSSKRMRGGEHIHINIQEKITNLTSSDAPLQILYQDDDLAIIIKDAGCIVHPCTSCHEETLVHQLLHHFPCLKNMEGERPGIVHRLDKDTSGLMIIALNEKTRIKLNEAFSQRTIHKIYLAMVQGMVQDGESELCLGRHPTYKTKMACVPSEKGGRDAHSEWERLYPQNPSIITPFSLLAVTILTGRTHQIRVHLSEAGHPLLGDTLYAPNHIAQLAKRQMLHAWKLDFIHPSTGEHMNFVCPPPPDFMEIALTLWEDAVKIQNIILTGNAGCGKSSALDIFQKFNIPTFSADTCIQELYQAGGDAHYMLHKQYGSRFVPDDTMAVDKAALAKAMENDHVRKEIQNIVHPLVYTRMVDFFKNTARENRFAVAEIPLWHESHTQKTDEHVICMTCSKDVRWARLEKREWDENRMALMDAWQWHQDDKVKVSDYVIENNDTLQTLENNIKNVLDEITATLQDKINKKKNALAKCMNQN